MKIKKINNNKKITILLVILFIIIYYIGTLNFVIIKPNPLIYFATAFDNVGDEWYCKEYNLKATVIEQDSINFMLVEDLNNNNKCYFKALGYHFLSIRKYCDDYNSSEELMSTGISYTKRWGKICKFNIYNIKYENKFLEGNDRIVFKKKII